MEIPDSIIEPAISLKDQYFDLKGLSVYSSLGVGTLRDYLKSGGLSYFKLRGKILIKRSEFDTWLERYRINQSQELNKIVDEVLSSMKS